METQAVAATRIMLGKNLQASPKFGDNLVEGAICLDILEDPKVKKLVYTFEGRRYLNVKVVKRKEANDFGKTHFLEIDQFVPKPTADRDEPNYQLILP